jgi:class 3 adenylate cyclase
MNDRPETQFAWNGDSALAYQVLGEGDADLLYLQGYISNVELNWDHPTMARFLHGLARSRRLIMTDPRGVGCSERSSPHGAWPLEAIMEDVAVVLDAVDSERATILANDHLGFVACMFAATYPERTAGVILYQSTANFLWSEETPWEETEESFEEFAEWTRKNWGTRAGALDHIRLRDPSMADDAAYLQWWHRYCLLSQGVGDAAATELMYMHADIRPILGSIHVPVLVLNRREVWVESARYLVDRIPGARFEALPGGDSSLWVGDQQPVHHAIDAFLGDIRLEQAELESVLATILFTDIVGSTKKAAELGDQAWRELLERHHTQVRALIERYRGKEVDTAGDGFFATFDGPARAIRCANAIVDEVRRLGIEVRIGVHTGECQTIDGKVGGIAVHIGARVGSAAGPSEVLASQTVKDLVVGSGLVFEDVGEHELKGVPDRWRLYRVVK